MSNPAAPDDEWTFVSRRRPIKANKPKRGHYQKQAKSTAVKYFLDDPEELAKVNAMPIHRPDIQKLLATIKNFRAKWSDSIQGRRLQDVLIEQLRGGPKIENAVVTGLGSFNPAARNDPYRGCWQLAVFLETVKLLLPTAHVPMYAQDPVFTLFDESLLLELDIVILPGYDAVGKCNDYTFLFVPFVEASAIFNHILPSRNPLLYIGSDVESIVDNFSTNHLAENTVERNNLAKQSRKVGGNFLQHRRKVAIDFNGFGEAALYGMAAFIRKADLEDEAEDDVGVDGG